MQLRAPLLGLLGGTAVGASLTLGAGAKLFPVAVNYLALPGIALMWGRSASWWSVVAVNAAVYGISGVLLGAAIAILRQRARRAPAA